MTMKHCKKCDTTKPLSEFHVRTYSTGNKGRQPVCKSCASAVRATYYRPHEVARRKFNLTEQEYSTLITRSKGCCEVCNKSVDKLCIDHDHQTKKIRGLLCNNCNTSLGLMYDDVGMLQKLIQYLEQSRLPE